MDRAGPSGTQRARPSRKKKHQKRIRVAILAFDGVLASAVAGLHDVLSAAGRLWPALKDGSDEQGLFSVSILAVQCGQIRCDNQFYLTANESLSDDYPDVVLVPTFIFPDRQQATFVTSEELQTLLSWLGGALASGCLICSVSNGSLLLAAAGLLDQKEAAIHWGVADRARLWFPRTDFRLDKDIQVTGPGNRIVTAGGGRCWQTLALHLIQHFGGSLMAAQTARMFTIVHTGAGQLPYDEWAPPIDHHDAPVRRVQEWLHSNYHASNTTEKSAILAALSVRTLKRRFKNVTGMSITEYTQRLRVQDARFRLESTSDSVGQISSDVGYEDTNFFRQVFKRYTGMTPRQFRGCFHMADDSALPIKGKPINPFQL